MVHDRDPVAEPVGLLHVVRGEQDRLARAVQLAEQVPQREPALRVEARGRLVQEQHRRAVEDGPGHHQPLGHAAGQRVHRRLGPLGQLELLEQVAGDLPGRLGPHAEQPAVEVQVLPHGELAVQRVLLRHDAAQLLGQRRVGGDVDRRPGRPARTSGTTRVVSMPAVVVLPAPFGPEQAEDLPGPHVEVELVDRGEVGARVDLGQVLGVDDGVRARRRARGPAGRAGRGVRCSHRPSSLIGGYARAVAGVVAGCGFWVVGVTSAHRVSLLSAVRSCILERPWAGVDSN